MAFLVAAVVLVGLLGLANLLFTFGVIRRLREHTELLNQLGQNGGSETVMLAPGRTVEDFTTTTLDGGRVSTSTMEGDWLVGFFSVGCRHCTTQLPLFVDRARTHPGGPERVFAVVVADETQDPQPYLGPLTSAARTLREEPAGPVAHAFGVVAFPAFAQVGPGGVVLASGSEVASLAAAAVTV